MLFNCWASRPKPGRTTRSDVCWAVCISGSLKTCFYGYVHVMVLFGFLDIGPGTSGLQRMTRTRPLSLCEPNLEYVMIIERNIACCHDPYVFLYAIYVMLVCTT